jgi:hypothetical protein
MMMMIDIPNQINQPPVYLSDIIVKLDVYFCVTNLYAGEGLV